MRLLAAASQAFGTDEEIDALAEEVVTFEQIVLYGVTDLPVQEYPPHGHDYPSS
ncbi:hypothetical protein OG625_38595 [Streptomyces sp. NBC_01351]|uniref:hypothetical protein n=1 Tax=Streptomyces sp. NBC_01351 TaxID=2903833 RepID=UPI002E30FF4F|nr:hypothetical protein [Streptomyces sp. NBC_01351]